MKTLRKLLGLTTRIAVMAGVNPGVLVTSLRNLPKFFRDMYEYRRKSTPDLFPLKPTNFFPILAEAHSDAGVAKGHYFHQDLWAAQKIFKRHPARHVDVGSRIDGFVSHILTFMPLSVVDIRPLSSDVSGLSFIQADATRLESILSQSVPSLSCLHAIEHFGLGRYGDPIDPEAPFKAANALSRILAPGGYLYLATPVGRQRLEFNAHRIFAPETVLQTFQSLELTEFSAVTDGGNLVERCDPSTVREANYACGLFEFRKPS